MIAFDEVLLAKADCLNMHGSVLVQSQLKHTIASGSNAGAPSLPETLKSDCDIKTTTLANELRNINAYLTVDTQSSQRQSASPELRWTELNDGILGMRRLVLSNIVTDGQSQVLSQSAGASIDYSQGGSTGVLANGELIATLLSDAFLASNHQSSRVGASALYHGKGNDSASKSKADKTASIEHPTDYHRTSRVPSVRSHTSGNGILGIHSLATDKDVLIMVVAVNTNVKILSANGSASYTPAASTKPMQQTEVAAPVVESMPAAGQAVGNPNNMPGSGHKPYMIYTYRISKVLENVNGCDVSIETLSNQCMHDEITPDLSVDLSLEVVQEIPLDYRPMCMALVDGHSFSAVINPSSCSSGTTSIESAASAPVLLIGGSDQHLHSYDLNVSTMHLTRTQDAHRDQLRDLWEELLFFAARRKGATTAGGMSNASLPASQRSVELKSLALPTAGFNSIISGATTGTQSTLTSALTIDVDFVSGSTGDVSDMGATVAAEQDISSNIESNTSGDGTNAGSSSQINNAETISRPLIDLPVDLLSEGSYINGEVGDNNGRKPDVLSSAGGISSNARESFSKSNSHFNQQTINRQVVSCFSSGVLVWMRIEESAKSLSETSSHPDHNAQGSLLSTSNDTSQYISADSIEVSSVGERCDSGVRIASKLSSVTSGTSLISPRKEETSIKSAILEDRVLDSDVDEEELVDQFDALAGCALSPSRNPEYWSSGSLGSGSKNSSNNALFEPGKIVPTSPYQHVPDAESVAADVNASQLPPAPVIAPAVEVLNSFSQGIQPHIYSSDAAIRDGSGLMLSRGCLKLDYPITCIAGLRSRCRKVVNVRSIPRSTSYGSVRGAISSSTDAALGDLLGEKQSLLSSHVVVGLAQGGIAIVTLTPDPAAIGVPTNAAHGRPSSESNGTAAGSNSKHSYKLTGAILDATIGNKPSYLPAYAQYGSCTCVYACDVTGDGWDDIFLGFADGTVVLLGRDHAAERLQLDQWRAQMRRQHQLQLQKKQLGKAFSNGQLTRSMSGSALERRQQSKSKSVNVTKSKNSSKDKNADSALENKDVSVLNLKTKAPVFSLDKEVAEEQDNVQAKDSECKDRDKILGNNDEKGQEKGKHIAGVKTRGKTKGDADIRLPGSALVFKEIWKAYLPFPICSLVYGRHLQSAQFLWPSRATSADGTCNAQKPTECNSNSGHGGWQVPNTLTVTTTKTVHVLVRRKQ